MNKKCLNAYKENQEYRVDLKDDLFSGWRMETQKAYKERILKHVGWIFELESVDTIGIFPPSCFTENIIPHSRLSSSAAVGILTINSMRGAFKNELGNDYVYQLLEI